jgi:hypothetical protein
MAQTEHHERYGWWLNELESLGINAERKKELNDLTEVSALTGNIKKLFYEEYQTAFNEK